MKVRLLSTDGKGSFSESMWVKPKIAENEIEVK